MSLTLYAMAFRAAQQSSGLASVVFNKCPQPHVWFRDTDHQLGVATGEVFPSDTEIAQGETLAVTRSGRI